MARSIPVPFLAARGQHSQSSPWCSALAKTRRKTVSNCTDPTIPSLSAPACPHLADAASKGSCQLSGKRWQGHTHHRRHWICPPGEAAFSSGVLSQPDKVQGSAKLTLVFQAGNRNERQHHLVSDMCSTEEVSPVLGQHCPWQLLSPSPRDPEAGGLWGLSASQPSSPSGFWRRLGLMTEMSLVPEKSPAWRPRVVWGSSSC